MSQAVLSPNLTKKFQWEVSQIVDKERSCAPLYRWFKCKLKPPKKWHFSLHIVTHLCQFMAQNLKIWGVKKNEQLFDISKIASLWPSKREIGHIFKNPHQGM